MAVLKLSPSYKNYLWGGDKLKREYHKDYEGEKIAESWELSCHMDGHSVIAEGIFAGKTLQEYIEWEGKKILGKNCVRFQNFPVLIKFIDAKENLSIQVHPSDAYAWEKEGQYGKTEMWYVVDCEKGAYLYYGFSKEITENEIKKRIQEETILEVLRKVPVKKGDVFFLDAGIVHAIGKGILIAEIQQNSNVTYRVYDYGRVGIDGKKRDLHIDKALQVVNRDPIICGKSFEPHLGTCEYFTVDKLVLDGRLMQSISGVIGEESFAHMLVIEGDGKIHEGIKKEEVTFEKGDSILLTAGTGEFSVKGSCEVLVTTVPKCE